MPYLAKMAEKMRMDDERTFGITKLELRAFSLAALEIILGVIVVKVRSMMERTSIQTTVDIINIRVYLRRDFPSLRSDNHTICDSKHFIC